MSFARHLLATAEAIGKSPRLPNIIRDRFSGVDMFNETRPERRTSFEETLCAMAGRVLVREYPGFHWAFRVDEEKGLWSLLNQDLSGQWGYTGKVEAVWSSTSFEKEILMAAGGILEFFGIARAPANQDKLVVLPTDFAGRTLPAGYKRQPGKAFDARKYMFKGRVG